MRSNHLSYRPIKAVARVRARVPVAKVFAETVRRPSVGEWRKRNEDGDVPLLMGSS